MKKRYVTNLLLPLATIVLAGCAVREPDALDQRVKLNALAVDEWMTLGKPGQEHNILAKFVGEWEVTISSRPTISATAELSAGRSQISQVLDGRFVEERFSGQVAGRPYEGRGYLGFDNTTRRYFSVWMESLSTAPTLSWGTYSPNEHLFSFVADVYDPLRGDTKRSYSKIVIHSPNLFTQSMIERSPEGEEFEAFGLIYKRR
jgi:hypothetical protein